MSLSLIRHQNYFIAYNLEIGRVYDIRIIALYIYTFTIIAPYWHKSVLQSQNKSSYADIGSRE